MTSNSDIDYKSMFDHNYPNNYSSAKQIVPYIIDLIKPKNVIDVGCGAGVWLKVFQDYGVNIHGIDGAWVKYVNTAINKEVIRIENLEKIKPAPGEHYDLAISLEVAEHIDIRNADNFIKYLTSVADVVLFGAATPNSGGQHHVNERWQSYWIKKFRNRGYEVIDCIRPKYWTNILVSYYYAQETFLFVKKDAIHDYPDLKIGKPLLCDVVHPELFINQVIKPTHEWKYLFNMQKKLLIAMKEKFIKEILQLNK